MHKLLINSVLFCLGSSSGKPLADTVSDQGFLKSKKQFTNRRLISVYIIT